MNYAGYVAAAYAVFALAIAWDWLSGRLSLTRTRRDLARRARRQAAKKEPTP